MTGGFPRDAREAPNRFEGSESSMKRLLLLAFLAGMMIVPRATALSGADGSGETLVGLLSYVPEPDVSICFCGSFRLNLDFSLVDCYLVSDSIDLGAFAGQRVLVYGRSFSGICTGTLARPCSYFDVRKIVPLTRAGTITVDWGSVKMIYR
jgi:hypothetical protein